MFRSAVQMKMIHVNRVKGGLNLVSSPCVPGPVTRKTSSPRALQCHFCLISRVCRGVFLGSSFSYTGLFAYPCTKTSCF